MLSSLRLAPISLRFTNRRHLATPITRSLVTKTPIIPVDLEYDQVIPSDGNAKDGALVILHGLFGSKRNWQSLAKVFSKELQRPVYALDLRNSGMSPHVKPMTYRAMAADVIHFCNKHRLRDISLIGHSMGGKVAMSVALDPELPPSFLGRLIVVDITPARAELSSEFKGYIEGMKKIEASKVKTRKQAEEILMEFEKDASVRAFLLTNISLPTPSNPYVHFRIPISILEEALPEIGGFPYKPEERKWLGNTLLIQGSLSRYTNDDNVELATQYFPELTLEQILAGHWVHSEKISSKW
ncbi:hypothetical protein PILCRDRAFT_374278 [Piloderma croceum F 1598]|uniref:AB hydrolase-1 domain-containing protein n=1 Tax=Piloderma croceum (strain F 1598) TaxID=765440 RepID=A0A0C3C5F5_PILCF|nr:hypothetical protein PILCRDRAFT_374278 [Piloderma croceum F 1598]